MCQKVSKRVNKGNINKIVWYKLWGQKGGYKQWGENGVEKWGRKVANKWNTLVGKIIWVNHLRSIPWGKK